MERSWCEGCARQEPSLEEVRRLAERMLKQLEMMGFNVDDIEKAIELVDIHREELAELMYLGDICDCGPEALIDLVTSGRSGELDCENDTARQPSTRM